MSRGRVLVAMSGGVDSSVAAWLLLEQGYECVGATMRLATNEDDRPGERTCCSVDDVADAREACWRLGIRHYVFDYTREFARDVIDPFVFGYEAGETPNPCVACNRRLKFGALLDRARELGCDYLATGHYARVEARGGGVGAPIPAGSRSSASPAGLTAGAVPAQDGRPGLRLLKGVDAAKDQSYFLFGLTQQRLAHVLFPLGGLVKATQVRRLAEEAGLSVAHKRDSEGICFVPGGDHQRFIEERTGRRAPDGDILDTEGRVLGRHHGALRYTLGQRKGLGVASDRPLYVCRIDVAANTVTLGDNADLMARGVVARDWNWVAGRPPEDGGTLAAGTTGAHAADASDAHGSVPAAPGSFRASAKVRYHQPDQPCRVTPLPDGRVRVTFDEPQRAATPGQAVVVYRGDELVGGGIISRVERGA